MKEITVYLGLVLRAIEAKALGRANVAWPIQIDIVVYASTSAKQVLSKESSSKYMNVGRFFLKVRLWATARKLCAIATFSLHLSKNKRRRSNFGCEFYVPTHFSIYQIFFCFL